MSRRILILTLLGSLLSLSGTAQTNPLWGSGKTKNYLPDMSWPEVEDLLKRTDMVIIPVASLEQHGLHLPIGTDFYASLSRAQLIAQRADVLVAPILFPGNSPYHMGFAGSVTLPAELIQEVYVESAKSLMRHGFKRFLIYNGHGGNSVISRYIVDRINHETPGIAVELGEAARPFVQREPPGSEPAVFDRHGGVGETSTALYLMPSLVNLEAAETAQLTLPQHLQEMLPEVVKGDPTAQLVFLAEGLKAEETGKQTSAREMSTTGVWGVRDPKEATVEEGRRSTENFVEAAVRFIERWNQLRPPGR